ncbi:MAG: ArsR/SmtB family transcription factor, partial [Acidimicrobiales bacterium]
MITHSPCTGLVGTGTALVRGGPGLRQGATSRPATEAVGSRQAAICAAGAAGVGSEECCVSVLAAPLGVGDAESLARGFTALADPVRLRLLSMLASAPEGEVCVCNFVAPLGKSQPTVSHHLKILGDVGLVHGQRRGKWVWYSLDRDRLA